MTATELLALAMKLANPSGEPWEPGDEQVVVFEDAVALVSMKEDRTFRKEKSP